MYIRYDFCENYMLDLYRLVVTSLDLLTHGDIWNYLARVADLIPDGYKTDIR